MTKHWLAALIFVAPGSVIAAGFTPLGDLPGGANLSMAHGLSDDGSVVVGHSFSSTGNLGREAFRWTSTTGMVGLGDFAGASFNSVARAVTADGNLIVGWGQSPAGIEAAMWTGAGGMVGLGDLPGGEFFSIALGISADGTVVAGQSTSSTFLFGEPFRWTATTGIEPLRPFARLLGTAGGVSDDGSVIVGNGFFENIRHGFVIDAGGFTIIRAFIEPGSSSAGNVSGDGTIVVGFAASASGREAFRWTRADGAVPLGDLPGGNVDAAAADLSADGTVVVGRGETDRGDEAFIWTQAAGMRSLEDVLASKGVVLSGWILENAAGVTPDGKWVVGTGVNPDGFTEAYRANLEMVVTVDILPNSKKNVLVPHRPGQISVALLSTSIARGDAVDFDATQIDVASLGFGPSQAVVVTDSSRAADIDHDGDRDFIVRFEPNQSGIACGQAEAVVRGRIAGGEPFVGVDSIRTVGCRR